MSVHYLPDLTGITPEQPFRFWCQKVLPLVYDDSLSYYELLCKVINYLNNTMQDVNTLAGDITTIAEAYTQLENYVNDYFDNLDVQEEINVKLDAMAQDGTLTSLISGYVTPFINQQNERITEFESLVNTNLTAQTEFNNVTRGMVASTYGAPIPVSSESDIPDGENAVVWIGATGTGPSGISWKKDYWYYTVKTGGTLTAVEGGLFNATALQTDKTLLIPNMAADAKATGDEIREIQEDLKNWGLLNGVKITSGNLYYSYTDRGNGAYFYNGTDIEYAAYANYKWFEMPVESRTVYYSPYPARLWYSLNAANQVVLYGDNAGTGYSTIGVGEGAVKVVVSYNYVNYPNYAIYKGSSLPSDTVSKFLLPDNVRIQNHAVDSMVKTGGQILSHNIFNQAELLMSGVYVDILDGRMRLVTAAAYDTYIIPVTGETYTLTFARTALLLASDKITAVGTTITYTTEINTTGGAYLAFSFKPADYPPAEYVVKKPLDRYLVPTNWVFSDNNWKSAIDSVSSPFRSGGGIELPYRSAVKDGERLVFKGKFTTFSSITLMFCTSSTQYPTNRIIVSDTYIITTYGTAPADTKAHGLTIANDICLIVEFVQGKAKIKLISNGNSFSVEYDWYQTAGATTYPAVVSSGTEFSEASLTAVWNCAMRDIWYFGDSYISFNQTDRFPYYLVEDGIDKNALFSGAGGGNSITATMAMASMLRYGTPKIAVFATGMNDGSDTNDSTPSAQWVTYRDEFITMCEAAGIEPMFGTVPTTPSVYNEGKNNWIRNSGYRYIDFARAVGADSTGAWYSGMLDNDNVHPTVAGAKALYSQVLVDLPEIMVNK